MKLICQNCGNEHSAYFSYNRHQWYVSVGQHRDGTPRLDAEPDDHEETRYYFNKLGPVGRIKEVMGASAELKARKTFDCSDCGEDDCVRIIET
jgi:hypothetical protein